MMDALYTLYPPGVKVLREIDHFRNYDVNVAIRDIESFQKNGHYQVAASANQMHYNRGYIRSGWVDKFAEDANREEMVRVRDELGAAQWTYLNNLGSVYSDKPDSNHYYRGDIGIYWTTDTLRASDVTSHGTSEKSNYSNELVLQYFYSTLTNKYYVIKNYVWVNQGDVANEKKCLRMALLIPVLLHGAYDFIASLEGDYSWILFILFVIGLFFYTNRLLKRQSASDVRIG